ncbi:MAG: type IX secretion system outer membrane channel protein PorV [Flavobacteriia bacterium]|nr:type IX secretion system outer membrane channel protein PorV [Flavobacteriia bacterium]
MIKRILMIGLFSASIFATAQNDPNPVLTGAPFLRVSPDARAGGLGDMGAATSADAFSQYWNPAKYAFSKSYSGVALSYTPYMSSITDDVFLLNASFYTFLGQEERSTLSASLYYFNIGEIDLTELVGTQIVNTGIAKPNEFSFDVSYGLRLSDTYSMAVTGRFIRSDLFNNIDDGTVQPANTFAVDVSGFYQTPRHDWNNFEGRLRAGFNVSNIGPKLDYSNSEDNAAYLPTNLRLGVGYDFIFDDFNTVALTLETNKLLVPTPTYEKDADGNEVPGTRYIPNKGVVEGMFSSFGDAPGGFKEEMQEFNWAASLEYSYNDVLFIRSGYFHESPMKGDRQHLTLGAGLKYNSFGLDFSYLIPVSKTNNALENTLRFALTWEFGGETSNTWDY